MHYILYSCIHGEFIDHIQITNLKINQKALTAKIFPIMVVININNREIQKSSFTIIQQWLMFESQ